MSGSQRATFLSSLLLLPIVTAACELEFLAVKTSDLPEACNKPFMPSAKRILRSIAKCSEDSKIGQMCEGMGQCGASNRLNNCGRFDLYYPIEIAECAPGPLYPVPEDMLAENCEDFDRSFFLTLPSCRSSGVGELCEGDGECGTSNVLNNCGKFDVYWRRDNSSTVNVKFPGYSQQCGDDAGPPWIDDEDTFGRGNRYHTNSKAMAVLTPDGTCPEPLKQACEMQNEMTTAYLEGPLQCGGKGWFCRILPDQNHGTSSELRGDYNFAHCNHTEPGDFDGHCHGSSDESTYYWWVRDHWHRNYAGRLRCCCDWEATVGVVSRCDYRARVPEGMAERCRDANEEHTGPGSGFSLGFEAGCPEYGVSSVPEPSEDMCWEVLNFAPGDSSE